MSFLLRWIWWTKKVLAVAYKLFPIWPESGQSLKHKVSLLSTVRCVHRAIILYNSKFICHSTGYGNDCRNLSSHEEYLTSVLVWVFLLDLGFGKCTFERRSVVCFPHAFITTVLSHWINAFVWQGQSITWQSIVRTQILIVGSCSHVWWYIVSICLAASESLFGRNLFYIAASE